MALGSSEMQIGSVDQDGNFIFLQKVAASFSVGIDYRALKIL